MRRKLFSQKIVPTRNYVPTEMEIFMISGQGEAHLNYYYCVRNFGPFNDPEGKTMIVRFYVFLKLHLNYIWGSKMC